MKKEYDFSKLKELKESIPQQEKPVGINLSPEVVDYFKGLAEETGLPYQEVDRSLSSRLREEAQEADHGSGCVAQGAWDAQAK